MNEPDYLIFITAQLIGLPESEFTTSLGDFAGRYEVQKLIEPGKVSIGGRYDGQLSFQDWLALIRKERLTRVQIFETTQDVSSITAAVAHAFAGTQHTFISIQRGLTTKTYGLQTFNSPRYDITPVQFVDLINQQPLKNILWERIGFLIQESNQLNQREPIVPKSIQDYMISASNVYGFDLMAGNLLDEIQIELALTQSELAVPDRFGKLVEKSERSPLFSPESGAIVFLYPLVNVSAQNLFDLIEAQAFKAEAVWIKLTELIKSYADPTLPALDAHTWPTWVSAAGPDSLARISNTVCRAIAEVCQDNMIDRIIPPSLGLLFGPDEKENNRAKARSNSSDRYYFTSNNEPWRMYFFEEMPNVQAPPSPDEAITKQNFITSLNAITSFARKIDSPFGAAFSLAAWILSDDVPSGNFDENHWKLIAAKLQQINYTAREIENVERSFFNISGDLLRMARPIKIFPMVSIDLADVFGGMGSWNDQYLEDPKLQEEYQQLTGELFERLRIFFAVAASE